MAQFSWDIRHYLTLLDYRAALFPFAVPAWVSGVTIHHTVSPAPAQWLGRRSMEALGRFYRAKGWNAGPHLFYCQGAPNPNDNGLWAGTPLASPGIHAQKCNADHVGLEVVGFFDSAPWTISLREQIYDLVTTLLHWMGRTEANVQGHRECGSTKTCPGSAISMPIVRRDIRDRLFDQRFVVEVSSARVRLGPAVNRQIISFQSQGASLSAHRVIGTPFQGSSDWARVRLPSSVIGYIWAGLGRFEAV